MVTKSFILANLKQIDVRYNNSSSTKERLFWSKLAIIELCGWIELTMDDIIWRCAKRRCRNASTLSEVEVMIKGTYGFKFKDHFRPMLINLTGFIGYEKLSKRFDSAKIDAMKSALGALVGPRNGEAHTYIKGVTRIIDAPSVTIGRFQPIYQGLLHIDIHVRSIRR
jgi:hypothetical protein